LPFDASGSTAAVRRIKEIGKIMEKLAKLKASRDANLALYSEYNKTLRSWFVAFGIAVPAVFVTSKDAKEFLLKSSDFHFIIIVFLVGVAGQIVISFLNKFISWSAYHRDDCTLMHGNDCHPAYKYLASHENAIWIDVSFDILTIVCFAWAVVELLTIG
jgi:hypothetical protein